MILNHQRLMSVALLLSVMSWTVCSLYAQDDGTLTAQPTQPCDWREGQPHKMHWPQTPDFSPRAIDVDVSARPADDFLCTQTGPITDIHIWGGFLRDVIPSSGPGSLTFELSIYADNPATADRWSRPKDPLWRRVFTPGEYLVYLRNQQQAGWFDPASGSYDPIDHWLTYQYNFCVHEDPFVQKKGTVYWLGVRVLNAQGNDSHFGWRTTLPTLHWNDDSVTLSSDNEWLETRYPEGHALVDKTLDLAL